MQAGSKYGALDARPGRVGAIRRGPAVVVRRPRTAPRGSREWLPRVHAAGQSAPHEESAKFADVRWSFKRTCRRRTCTRRRRWPEWLPLGPASSGGQAGAQGSGAPAQCPGARPARRSGRRADRSFRVDPAKRLRGVICPSLTSCVPQTAASSGPSPQPVAWSDPACRAADRARGKAPRHCGRLYEPLIPFAYWTDVSWKNR
jgi:hypothetical protein